MNLIYIIFTSLLIALACLSCSPRHMVKNETTAESTNKKVFTPGFTVPEVDADFYEDCLRKFESRNPDSIIATDLIKFRYSYLAYKEKTGKYVPTDLEKEFGLAVRDKDFRNVEELADKILDIDFTDSRVHLMKAYALKSNGKDFSFHKAMVERLEKSILATGDGKSPETAFHVAQVKEEYAILYSFGFDLSSQTLSKQGNHSFDIMECKSREGKKYTIYFDITEHMNAIYKKFK